MNFPPPVRRLVRHSTDVRRRKPWRPVLRSPPVLAFAPVPATTQRVQARKRSGTEDGRRTAAPQIFDIGYMRVPLVIEYAKKIHPPTCRGGSPDEIGTKPKIEFLKSSIPNFSLTLLDSYQPRRAFLRGQVSIFNPNPLIFRQTLPTPTARPRK